jgi:hypothetical protein
MPEQDQWTKEEIVTRRVTPGIADKSIRRYRADSAANPPSHKRIAVSGFYTDGKPYTFDKSEAEIGITEENSAMLDTAGEAAVALLLTISGFQPPTV